jgi:MYXO-CTERM domain-containing protein
VNVGAFTAVGDLWTTLTLTFTQQDAYPGLLAGADVNFYADTDMIERSSITQAPVPEPASCALFGSLALAAACHYRRRRSA